MKTKVLVLLMAFFLLAIGLGFWYKGWRTSFRPREEWGKPIETTLDITPRGVMESKGIFFLRIEHPVTPEQGRSLVGQGDGIRWRAQ